MFFGERYYFKSELKIRKGLTMLVLSRKKDEKILIRVPGQEDISITVVRIDNQNKVRLGIEAEDGISILRSELDDDKATPLLGN